MTSMCLTPQQQRLLDIIKAHVADHNRAPSCQQMAEAMGFNSKSGVHRLLLGLEERGAIRRLPGKARAIAIIDPAPPLTAMQRFDIGKAMIDEINQFLRDYEISQDSPLFRGLRLRIRAKYMKGHAA